MNITYIILYLIIFFAIWIIGFKTVKNAKVNNKDDEYYELQDSTNGEIIFISGIFAFVWPITFIIMALDIITSRLSKLIHMILPKRFFEWLHEI